MKKLNRLPREQVTGPEGDVKKGDADRYPGADTDVEGHRADFLPGLPGTGGDDLHRPIGAGEATEDDVEGHSLPSGGAFLPGLPGTGGDRFRRPVGGGEIADDDVDDSGPG